MGAHRPVSVPSGMYQRAFAKKSGSVRGLSAPPGAPPVLGFLVRSAEGLPALPDLALVLLPLVSCCLPGPAGYENLTAPLFALSR
jgi:hypothetical protein